jgi:hypothetical protein
MKDEGWTYNDLAGELWARGVDITNIDIEVYIESETVEMAADVVEKQAVKGGE